MSQQMGQPGEGCGKYSRSGSATSESNSSAWVGYRRRHWTAGGRFDFQRRMCLGSGRGPSGQCSLLVCPVVHQ